MPTRFDDDDGGYATWLTSHPDGFLGNFKAAMSPNYFTVHRATCFRITPGSARSNAPGAFTSRIYRKVCSTDIEPLRAWGRANGFTTFHLCGGCNPGVGQPGSTT